jgi:hypothetical protein
LDRRSFRFSWRYVDGKAGYATFKVKDAVTKRKKSQSTTVIFNYFSRKKIFQPDFILNMPIIYMNITTTRI